MPFRIVQLRAQEERPPGEGWERDEGRGVWQRPIGTIVARREDAEAVASVQNEAARERGGNITYEVIEVLA